MRREYGGVEIELTPAAWITWEGWRSAVPIFHAWAPPEGEKSRSRCGLDLNVCTYIPARFAVVIGRPCRTCWPELRPQLRLFERPRRPRPLTATRQETLA